MKTQLLRPVALVLLSCLCAVGAQAASSATSSASDSVASSVGSVSDSVKGSSNSSSRGTGVAAGDYQLKQFAESSERPGMVNLKMARLNTAADDAEVTIVVPQQAFTQGELALGSVIQVREKAYGLELTNASTQQAFFLVLLDEWHQELATKPVVL